MAGLQYFTNALTDVGTLTGTERIPLDLAAGGSSWTTPAEILSYVSANASLRIVGSLDSAMTSSQVLMNIPMKTGDALPAGLAASLVDCTVAPTADVTLVLSKISAGTTTAIGSATILAGHTSGTWTLAAPVTFSEATNDRLLFAAPSIVDATLSGLGWLISATRTQ